MICGFCKEDHDPYKAHICKLKEVKICTAKFAELVRNQR